MDFKKIKKYITNCGEEFALCVNKLIVNNISCDEINSCLSSPSLPDLIGIKERLKYNSEFDLEFNYIRYIILTLLSLKKEDAKVIWETYFYTGKKEIYYERTVDYRHRVKASNKFYNQINNI